MLNLGSFEFFVHLFVLTIPTDLTSFAWKFSMQRTIFSRVGMFFHLQLTLQQECNVSFNTIVFFRLYHINFNDKGRSKKARTDAAAQHDGKKITAYFTAASMLPKPIPSPLTDDEPLDDETHDCLQVDADDAHSEVDDYDSDEDDTVHAANAPTVDDANSEAGKTLPDINWTSPTQSDKVRFEKAGDALETKYFSSSKPSEIGCKYDARRAMATSMFFSKLSEGCSVGVAAKDTASTFYRKNNTVWRQQAIVKWAKYFIAESRLPLQQQGKHIKVVSLIADAQISKQATSFFKSLKDGERTAEKFRSWVNDSLLPGLGDGRKFKNGTAKPNVSITTARTWLHLLGWIYGSHKKDVYVDGMCICICIIVCVQRSKITTSTHRAVSNHY